MSISQLIDHNVPVLAPEETIAAALDVIDNSSFDGLPVVSDDDYLAIVTEDSLLGLEDTNIMLAESGLMHYKPFVTSYAHPFEAISLLHHGMLPVLPVIDADNNKYMGSITKDMLIGYVATNSGIANPGGILVLEVHPRNYSMYEIARICENEDTVILTMHSKANDRGMIEVALKLNRTVLDAVVSSFELHKYMVLEVHGAERDADDIAGKYSLLMNYINM